MVDVEDAQRCCIFSAVCAQIEHLQSNRPHHRRYDINVKKKRKLKSRFNTFNHMCSFCKSESCGCWGSTFKPVHKAHLSSYVLPTMPRLLASCWFLAYLWHFKLSGAPVFLIMPIQILGSRKPNREVRSTLECSLNLFQVDEEAMCRIKPRESVNVAKGREQQQRWGQRSWRWRGVTGRTDRWDWLISQSKAPNNLSRKMESVHVIDE